MLIDDLLHPYDVELPHLECDGFTRVAHYVLNKNGISHQCFRGTVTVGGRTISHWWIKSGSMTVDFRLRMWMGENVPHGIFDAERFPQVKYEGEEIPLHVSPIVFEILTQKTA